MELHVERTVELTTQSRIVRNFLCNAAGAWQESLGSEFCVQLATLGHAVMAMDRCRCGVRDELEALTIETNDLRRQHQDVVAVFDDDLHLAILGEREKTAQTIAELENTVIQTEPKITAALDKAAECLEVANQARQQRMAAHADYTENASLLNKGESVAPSTFTESIGLCNLAILQRAEHLMELARLRDEITSLDHEKARLDKQTASLLEATRQAKAEAISAEKQLLFQADDLNEATETLKEKNERIRSQIVERCHELESMLGSITHDADLLDHDQQLPLLEQRKQLEDLNVQLTERIQALRKEKASTQQNIEKTQAENKDSRKRHAARLLEIELAEEHCVHETEKHNRAASDLRRKCKVLERKLAEAESEANRRRRVLDGLNSRVEVAEEEMMAKTETTSEMVLKAMAVEGEINARREDHEVAMAAGKTLVAELEDKVAVATANGADLDAQLQSTQQTTDALRKDLDLGRDRLEKQRETQTIAIRTTELNISKLEHSIHRSKTSAQLLKDKVPQQEALNTEHREKATAQLKQIAHETRELELSTARMKHEDEILEGPISALIEQAAHAQAEQKATEKQLERIKLEVISQGETHSVLTSQLAAALQPNQRAKRRLRDCRAAKASMTIEYKEDKATWEHRVQQVANRLTTVKAVNQQVEDSIEKARQDLARSTERCRLATYNLEVIEEHCQGSETSSGIQSHRDSADIWPDQQPRQRRRGSISIVLSEETLTPNERLLSPKGYRKAIEASSEQTIETLDAVSAEARQLERLVTQMHGISQRMVRAQATLRLASAELASRHTAASTQPEHQSRRNIASSRAYQTRSFSSNTRPRLRQTTSTSRLGRTNSDVYQLLKPQRNRAAPSSANAVLQHSH
eukprot:TRINITY_DN8866_c0_g1_i4.p1 TRINITY_DN8866_c0_g1~~TRINITY_DN8866_c0_g1_i4.p1  ORF type:complete len:873 (+),score=198.37 TRINITY_DN8866_c0_g1_i4:125-2743(+)